MNFTNTHLKASLIVLAAFLACTAIGIGAHAPEGTFSKPAQEYLAPAVIAAQRVNVRMHEFEVKRDAALAAKADLTRHGGFTLSGKFSWNEGSPTITQMRGATIALGAVSDQTDARFDWSPEAARMGSSVPTRLRYWEDAIQWDGRDVTVTFEKSHADGRCLLLVFHSR